VARRGASPRLALAGGTPPRDPPTSPDATVLVAPPLYAVVDPMGDARALRATSIVSDLLRDRAARGLVERSEASVRAAIEAANHAVVEAVSREPSLRGIGCTIACAVVANGECVIAWAGDVRVYRLRGFDLTLLTRDHDLVNDYVRKNAIDPTDAEAITKLPKGVIVRAIGMAPAIEVDTRVERTMPDDVFLLAPVGLYALLGDDELNRRLHEGRTSASQCLQALARAAKQRGLSARTASVAIRALDRAPWTQHARATSLLADIFVPIDDRVRINERIVAPEVRVIDADGAMLGALPTHEALRIAHERGLDLVEINPDARPPVCKILDAGKYSWPPHDDE
jgi:serine/threonine protein phosphatase PrpC